MEITWDEFWKITFQDAMAKVIDSNAMNFTFMGYKFVEMKLTLRYNDSFRVFLYNRDSSAEKGYTIESYWTKSFEHEEEMENMKYFTEIYEHDKPETDIEFIQARKDSKYRDKDHLFRQLETRFGIKFDLTTEEKWHVTDETKGLDVEVAEEINDFVHEWDKATKEHEAMSNKLREQQNKAAE